MEEGYSLEKLVWTEDDFNKMIWHDCNIYALAFDKYTYKLMFDIDYIFDWMRSQRFFGQSAKQHFVDAVVARYLGTSEGFGSPVVSVPGVGCRRPQYIRRWLGGRIRGSDRISSVRFLS